MIEAFIAVICLLLAAIVAALLAQQRQISRKANYSDVPPKAFKQQVDKLREDFDKHCEKSVDNDRAIREKLHEVDIHVRECKKRLGPETEP